MRRGFSVPGFLHQRFDLQHGQWSNLHPAQRGFDPEGLRGGQRGSSNLQSRRRLPFNQRQHQHLLHHLQSKPLHACFQLPKGLQRIQRLRHHQWRNLLHHRPRSRAESERSRSWPLSQPGLLRLPQGLHHVHGMQYHEWGDLL